MKHLINYSMYQSLESIPGEGDTISRLRALGCDGLELFTLFKEVPELYHEPSPSVHLPYAIDWYTGWTEKVPQHEYDEYEFKYLTFGKSRDEMVNNIRDAITFASRLDPAYGVLHAGSANLDETMHRQQTGNSREILKAFAEMVNTVTSGFPRGEPPFKLAFENLWWPGLKLAYKWEYELLEDKLEFDNWGFCLDTGHLMNTLPDAYEESHCIDRLLEIFSDFPQEMKDRIGTMHLHQSTSAEYRNTFEEMDRPAGESMSESVARVYPHVLKIDQHRPFTDPRCVLLVEALSPDFVTHEMIGADCRDVIANFVQQRSHFK
jgi:Xylose isomerase-like TIM barrel.